MKNQPNYTVIIRHALEPERLSLNPSSAASLFDLKVNLSTLGLKATQDILLS